MNKDILDSAILVGQKRWKVKNQRWSYYRGITHDWPIIH